MSNPTPQQQLAFFETFGFLKFPGLFADSLDWIKSEFKAVFDDRGVQHDDVTRSKMVPFIDQRERFSTMLDDPRLRDIATLLLGDDYNYVGSHGNYYVGDTHWHWDGNPRDYKILRYVHFVFYLDPVAANSGALRVIPGSHRIEPQERWDACRARECDELWGIPGNQVPHYAIESTPGDLLVFNHNVMHASFGGNTRRPMFGLNFCRRAKTDAQLEDMRVFVNRHYHFWEDKEFSEPMRATASPERYRHLEQALSLEPVAA